ncbi:Sensor histidine kinase CpxA [compost metagenome]
MQCIADQAVDLGQDCQVEGHCSHPFLAAPRALGRVVQNLVDNGLRYGQRVRIQLLDHPDAVEIQVHDDGPGLPAELLEKVFEPYFRAESSRNRETGGTGLGLTIARNLVQAHGGRIWLEQGAEGGLVVRVLLPFELRREGE